MNNALDVVQNYSMAFWPIHKVYSGRDCPIFFQLFLEKWRRYQEVAVRDTALYFSDTPSLTDWLDRGFVGVVLFDEVALTFRAHCIGELQVLADEQGYAFTERDRHIDTAVSEVFRRDEVERKLNDMCRATIYTHYYEFPVLGEVPMSLLWRGLCHERNVRFRVMHPKGFVSCDRE